MMVSKVNYPLLMAQHQKWWLLESGVMGDGKHIEKLYGFIYPVVNGGRDKFGANLAYQYSLYISHLMGSRLELRIEFPNHLVDND